MADEQAFDLGRNQGMDQDPRSVVRDFLMVVRSGRTPQRAAEFLAPRVVAHQVQSEVDHAVSRTPEEYADHVREMLDTWGSFTLTVDELLADDGSDKVYARWTQRGRHLAEFDGFAATHREVVQVTSAVYRVADGRIQEYWIQADRHGLHLQLAGREQVV